MRRDEEKVKDYARRHEIARWYTDADALLADTEVNAIYIATPPHVHLHYVEKALAAGKMAYVEKPLALNAEEAKRMRELLQQYNGKLVVAHYRRANPYFVKIREIIEKGEIGNVSLINLKMYKKAQTVDALAVPKNQWRVDPAISGGGLFHDLAPHQVDLMLAIFGQPKAFSGLSDTTGTDLPATRVSGQILFAKNILFQGLWDFDRAVDLDECEIMGTAGTIRFSFFDGMPIRVERDDEVEKISFEPLQHVQQPMIEQTVRYFRGEADNPCTISDGIVCMEIMDAFTK
jgi:predicted dehydrogenase